jgi:hypothetical protein
MSEWLRLAREPHVVRRALTYAVVVGSVLIAINHGDALLHGEVTPVRLLRMGLTAVVPYLVSTLSSVGAIRQAREEAGTSEEPERSLSAPGPGSAPAPGPASAPGRRS